ncbi:MAG: response regulator [Myxococcota bacterium]
MVRTETRVLVVDDDRRLAETLARQLRGRGYDVTTAYNIGDAKIVIESLEPDVLLSDLEIGPELGTELLMWADSHDFGPCCILMTGTPGFTMPSRLRHVPLLAKPFRMDELVELIDARGVSDVLAATLASEQLLNDAHNPGDRPNVPLGV